MLWMSGFIHFSIDALFYFCSVWVQNRNVLSSEGKFALHCRNNGYNSMNLNTCKLACAWWDWWENYEAEWRICVGRASENRARRAWCAEAKIFKWMNEWKKYFGLHTLRWSPKFFSDALCVGKLTSIASDNGLSPGRRQAIIWNIAGIMSIGSLGTNFSEILIEIQTFSLKKIRLKMSSAKCRPFASASMC